MNSNADLTTLRWPIDRLGEGLETLAKHAGQPNTATVAPYSAHLQQPISRNDLDQWVQWSAERLGVEAEPVSTPIGDVRDLLLEAGPAVWVASAPEGPVFYLLLKSRWNTVRLIAPDLKLRTCPPDLLRQSICASAQRPHLAQLDELLALADVPAGKRARARNAMLNERLANQEVGQCWMLRPAPETPFWQQLKTARMPQRMVQMVSLFAVVYCFEIASWALVGRATLSGNLDRGWMAAWAILIASLIPLRMLGKWLDAGFSITMGRLMKARLLAGSLRMDVEVVRRLGAGQLLGRVMDSQAFESLALNGGMGFLIAIVELAIAAMVLSAGAGAGLHLVLLLVWLGVTLGFSWQYARRLKTWTLDRLNLTNDLVERMVGHTTRLAQERRGRRDQFEDLVMNNYLRSSRDMDESIVPVAGLLPRGWMLIALLGLVPGLMAGTTSSVDVAIALGGMLLANRALSGISGGIGALARAVIAWDQIGSLFRAASANGTTLPCLPPSSHMQPVTRRKNSPSLVDGSQLTFSYGMSFEPAVQGVDLNIQHGDRILLEGGSGGGKSTLASLLVGLRTAQSGLLLLNGLDRHTLGESWHSIATEAPQFHDNHILNGSLAFNLLMGRNWPASDGELDEALSICNELGLGELVARMPSGLMQQVGETGWQLSHGERSRIFLARALLQMAQLTILDESFAALDPQTLEKCLNCALHRANTLLVIAHP